MDLIKRSTQKTITAPYWTAPLAMLAVVCALVAYVTHEPSYKMLQTRADRVFSFDREHYGKLPAHELRTLSLALAFHDHAGAEKILNKLEQSL